MAAFSDYENHDAVGLAALVASGETTPEELLEAAIERVEARNGAVNAVTARLYDHGRRAIADGLPDGPLRGVPYLLKDLSASLAGFPTTRGCRFFADVVPTEDSELVKRLKRAGVVIFGRTNTCELGLSLTCEPQLHGATKNPWDTARIAKLRLERAPVRRVVVRRQFAPCPAAAARPSRRSPPNPRLGLHGPFVRIRTIPALPRLRPF